MSDKPEGDVESEGTGTPAKSSGDPTQAGAPTADMQAFIGRQLRAVYDDIARQPVPDRFVELMKQLES